MKVGEWVFLYTSEYFFMLGIISRVTKKTVYYHRLAWDKRNKSLKFDISTYVSPVKKWTDKPVTNRQLRTMMKAAWDCTEFINIGLL